MQRGLDVEKAEAALKRAAHKALHGTREERSGRFMGKDKIGRTSRGELRSSSGRDPTKRRDDLLGTRGPKFRSMKITQDVRDYAATMNEKDASRSTQEQH